MGSRLGTHTFWTLALSAAITLLALSPVILPEGSRLQQLPAPLAGIEKVGRIVTSEVAAPVIRRIASDEDEQVAEPEQSPAESTPDSSAGDVAGALAEGSSPEPPRPSEVTPKPRRDPAPKGVSPAPTTDDDDKGKPSTDKPKRDKPGKDGEDDEDDGHKAGKWKSNDDDDDGDDDDRDHGKSKAKKSGDHSKGGASKTGGNHSKDGKGKGDHSKSKGGSGD